jgi:hypothetical protein
MIDTDGDRDYTEEAAVRAESDAEHASEQAHADLVNALAAALRQLGSEAHLAALSSLGRLHDEVNLRLAPNAHRYELLARQQHTALLAATVAAELETTGRYDLVEVAQSVAAGYRSTHRVALRAPDDLLNRSLASAIGRVLDLVREAVAR